MIKFTTLGGLTLGCAWVACLGCSSEPIADSCGRDVDCPGDQICQLERCVDFAGLGGAPAEATAPDSPGQAGEGGEFSGWWGEADGVSEVSVDASCATGTVFSGSDWGAGLVFELCPGDGPNMRHSLGDCPSRDSAAPSYVGVSFDIEGSIGESMLVSLLDTDLSLFGKQLTKAGHHDIMFGDTVSPLPSAQTLDPDALEAVAFVLLPQDEDYDFDFCVKNLALIEEGSPPRDCPSLPECIGGDVYQVDGCTGAMELDTDCGSADCQNGICLCKSHDSRICVGSTAYFQDSCGKREGIAENCSESCKDGVCTTTTLACSCSCSCSGCTSTVQRTCNGPNASVQCSNCQAICRESCTNSASCGSYISGSGTCH